MGEVAVRFYTCLLLLHRAASANGYVAQVNDADRYCTVDVHSIGISEPGWVSHSAVM